MPRCSASSYYYLELDWSFEAAALGLRRTRATLHHVALFSSAACPSIHPAGFLRFVSGHCPPHPSTPPWKPTCRTSPFFCTSVHPWNFASPTISRHVAAIATLPPPPLLLVWIFLSCTPHYQQAPTVRQSIPLPSTLVSCSFLMSYIVLSMSLPLHLQLLCWPPSPARS